MRHNLFLIKILFLFEKEFKPRDNRSPCWCFFYFFQNVDCFCLTVNYSHVIDWYLLMTAYLNRLLAETNYLSLSPYLISLMLDLLSWIVLTRNFVYFRTLPVLTIDAFASTFSVYKRNFLEALRDKKIIFR